MLDRPYLVSGRNTLIHKVRKLDLLLLNGIDAPAVLVTHRGLKEYEGTVPDNRRDAKMMDMELVDVTANDVFGDEKTLIFVQALNGKEYKIDYSKVGSKSFIKVHLDSIF